MRVVKLMILVLTAPARLIYWLLEEKRIADNVAYIVLWLLIMLFALMGLKTFVWDVGIEQLNSGSSLLEVLIGSMFLIVIALVPLMMLMVFLNFIHMIIIVLIRLIIMLCYIPNMIFNYLITDSDVRKILYSFMDKETASHKKSKIDFRKSTHYHDGWYEKFRGPVYEEYMKALQMYGLKYPYTKEELRRRRNELIKIYHPDECCGDTEKAVMINSYFNILELYIDND